jgi:glycosyltransferase involved in cell wall biosynthesis
VTAAAPARYRLDPLMDAPLIGPRVLQLVGDESGCSMWRSWQPVAHLRLMGYPADWERVHNPWLIDVPLEAYGALVLCRLSWPAWTRGRAERWMRTMKKGGRRLLFEADDDLFTPFMVDQQLGRVRAEKTRAELEADREASLWVLARCDGVTVSTQYLASTVRRFTDAPVEVVPNAIDDEWFAKTQKGVPRPVPGVTIGWAGGNRPDRDLAQMAVAWGRIAARFPDVAFVVMGHQPPVIGEHVPEGRIHRVPWMEAEQYPRGMVGIDVGCCPLDDHPFNRSKTPIKAWEYALSGAAVVASPTVYGKVIRHAANGHLASTADEWEHALAYLLEHPKNRGVQADNLKHDVLQRWTLRKGYWRWPAAWNRLMGNGGAT